MPEQFKNPEAMTNDEAQRIKEEIERIVADHKNAVEDSGIGVIVEERKKHGRPSPEEENIMHLIHDWVPRLKKLAEKGEADSKLIQVSAETAAGALEKIGIVDRLDAEHTAWLENIVGRKLENNPK